MFLVELFLLVFSNVDFYLFLFVDFVVVDVVVFMVRHSVNFLNAFYSSCASTEPLVFSIVDFLSFCFTRLTSVVGSSLLRVSPLKMLFSLYPLVTFTLSLSPLPRRLGTNKLSGRRCGSRLGLTSKRAKKID